MRRIGKICAEWGQIALGTFVLALGINLFLLPNQISAGGISAIGTVLLYLAEIPLSVTNFVLNLGLVWVGVRVLGIRAVMKTGGGILLLSLFLELTSRFRGYTEDMLLATLFGGVAIGIGVGLVVRQGASTGGSDFAALILHRRMPHLSVAQMILWIDLLIILLSGGIFGSIRVIGFSVLCMYVISRVADAILSAGQSAKQMQIFSAHTEEIAARIMRTLSRGVSALHCTGMYSGQEGRMLLCVVSPKELPSLFSIVHAVDPGAFVVVSDVREVHGKGFSE